nr:hypothetical protein [Helminthosporium velutinum]
MELEIVPQPAPVQTNPKTSDSKALSSNSVPVALTRWKSRRRGACGMCKLKKVRCDGGTPCMNCRRNNQECEYTLAKKHQASKKSVGSAPRIIAPRFWKKANGTSSSITAPAAEVLNNGQPSPALNIPFQGSPVNSNDTVPTHAQSSTSDSYSAQSLMDEYSNDTNWNFDFDLEGILLPPGDLRNVLDFQKFSWPALAANDDRNLDFDVPVTADGLHTANYETPVATLHNEYPPYLRPLSHSLHSTEGPGDWVKMVDINDKVRSSSWNELGPAGDLCTNHDPKVTAKSFLGQCYQRREGVDKKLTGNTDPIPSLNFSLRAIFSWQDCSNQVSNNTEQEDVQRIFSSISPVNNQQTPTNTNEEHQRTYASWYWNDTALMERCVNGGLLRATSRGPICRPNFIASSDTTQQSLDRDWIDFAPPRASTDTDWFRIQCLYASVIGSAASLLYSQRGLRQSAAEREHKLDLSFKLLEDWRSHLPPALRQIHKADIQGIMADYHVHHIALCMFRQYHEAIFLIRIYFHRAR